VENSQWGVDGSQGAGHGLIDLLEKADIPGDDTRVFGEFVAAEKPESAQGPLGAKTRKWLGCNLEKAAVGTWNIGIAVATDMVKEAALRHYGLK